MQPNQNYEKIISNLSFFDSQLENAIKKDNDFSPIGVLN